MLKRKTKTARSYDYPQKHAHILTGCTALFLGKCNLNPNHLGLGHYQETQKVMCFAFLPCVCRRLSHWTALNVSYRIKVLNWDDWEDDNIPSKAYEFFIFIPKQSKWTMWVKSQCSQVSNRRLRRICCQLLFAPTTASVWALGASSPSSGILRRIRKRIEHLSEELCPELYSFL